jgi:MoaA/NifB/PqqE/SkfB family radical SAM enzyme
MQSSMGQRSCILCLRVRRMTDIEIGNNCNSCCVMCTSLMPVAKDYVEPSTEEVLRQIDGCSDGSFTITGGEPLIRRDIFRILEYINEEYPEKKIKLITNGRLFCYPKFVEKLQNVKKLCVVTELHAADDELHDEITQSPGSFEQSLGGIKRLLAEGFKVEFRIVVSKLNYKEVPGIAELVVKEFREVDKVVIFPIDIIGNAFRNKERTVVKYKELVPYVCRAVKAELYHIPYCVIGKDYYKFIKKGVTVKERRVVLAKVCKGCRFETECPRVWKTYAKQVGEGEFGRIL